MPTAVATNRAPPVSLKRGAWFEPASQEPPSPGYVSHGGLATRCRHPPNGEIASVEIDRALRLDYRLDATGGIVGIEENGRSRRYGYTHGRLTHASTATGVYTYRHDAVGNRLERTVEDADGARHERYRYGDTGRGNRPLAVLDESSSQERVHAYGGNGAPRQIGELVYTHDAERRPVAVHRDGSLLARYAYNAFGETRPEDGLPERCGCGRRRRRARRPSRRACAPVPELVRTRLRRRTHRRAYPRRTGLPAQRSGRPDRAEYFDTTLSKTCQQKAMWSAPGPMNTARSNPERAFSPRHPVGS